MVAEGALVAQGAPVLAARRNPAFRVTAPMPGRTAGFRLGPGHRLSSVLAFHELDAGRHDYHTGRVDDPGALRELLLGAELWRTFRSRPLGRVPVPGKSYAAIVVIGQDTRPLAPSPASPTGRYSCAKATGTR